MKKYSRKGYQKWTPAADELLHGNLGLMHSGSIASKINSMLGTKFSRCAVDSRVSQLGLEARSCQGLMTLSEAARSVGITPSALLYRVRRNNIPTTGTGPYRFLTEAGLRQVQEIYRPANAPSISSTEAGKRLGFHSRTIRYMWAAGKIPGQKFGTRLLIPLVEVERRERIMRGQARIGDREAS